MKKSWSLTFYLIFYLPHLLVATDSLNTTAGSDELAHTNVGWIDSPSRRGTLTLVLGCLSTILASTWAVLHLNVPAPTDDWKVKLIRKVKWMTITILFPELVLSKAVCELRLAVADQYAMHTMAKPLDDRIKRKWKTTQIVTFERVFDSWLPRDERDDGIRTVVYQWEWKIDDVGGGLKFLHWLFGLEKHADEVNSMGNTQSPGRYNNGDIQDKIGQGEIQVVAGPRVCEYKVIRTWTLLHSYYLNMGGLHISSLNDITTNRHFDKYDPVTNGRPTFPLTTHSISDGNLSLLEHITLDKADIEDKSKADWLVKTFAILQIGWLFIEVIARRASKLPLTQLEIATTAFTVTAIFTYAANWWKPKDVNSPTILKGPTKIPSNEDNRLKSVFWTQLDPVRHSITIHDKRVKNDLVWGTGIFSGILAASSLLFGCIHCLAWNFEFPTKAEHLLWRGASITTAFLPGLALGMKYLFGRFRYRRRGGPQEMIQEMIMRIHVAYISMIVSIIIEVLYSIARLILIAPVFSCLRSVPDAVYNNIVWTSFIPSFS
ncbi:uncharacterized protein LY89DRAFT_742328 [Mollisia scopiformis]|uniref:Uncharacterized protein n=1 Tax=Mollisia scopiformis TaxID=149040 RepID=A0A132B715_MOLSC|nr:uncharacterized protein LY89DRAFT_742328 [Mollisia scopiformis]KUJ08033.1 hypothetical protein LY89DRAFT_742328 [Mollisia scopiformis]